MMNKICIEKELDAVLKSDCNCGCAEKIPMIWEEKRFQVWTMLYEMKNAPECAICFEQMNPMKRVLSNPWACKHVFHRACFSKFVQKNMKNVEIMKQI